MADEQAFVMMPARTLMAMTLGESLFLNPKLPSGKSSPTEISHLLGEEGSPLSTQTVLEGGEALLLSEVAEPPAQMVDSLTTLFKTLKTVKRAFLCSIKERADAPANLLIGIEAEGILSHYPDCRQRGHRYLAGRRTDRFAGGGRREGHQPLYDCPYHAVL